LSDIWMHGVYPDMRNGVSGSREDFLRMRLKEAFGHYSTVFPELKSLDDFARYLEKQTPKMRELLLEVDTFVGIINNELDSIPEYLQDATALVIMFSIIETLQLAVKKYVGLSDWLQSKESTRRLDELLRNGDRTDRALKTLVEDYFSSYGSIHAVTDFFENCLSKSEKKKLVQDYRLNKRCLKGVWEAKLQMLLPAFNRTMTIDDVSRALGDRVQVDEAFLPACYCTTCFVGYGNCYPSYGCRLDDEQELRKNLSKVTKRLVYSYRNAFVHKSRLPIIPREGSSNRRVVHVFDYLEDRVILHTLDIKFLVDAFCGAFRRFFEQASQNIQSDSVQKRDI
jgi:hypothetical protein